MPQTQETTKKSAYAQIKYCLTFSTVTPESAEEGNFARNGYCDESGNLFPMPDDMWGEKAKKFGEENTLIADGIQDILNVAESLGISYHGDADWCHSCGEEVLSYEKGETIEYCLHVDDNRQSEHVYKALEEKPYKF